MKNSKQRHRLRRARINRWLRLGIQAAFLVLAPSLFSAGFNGVKYVFGQLGTSLPLEATSFLVLLLALLAFTVVFGRFFCGYACAFGTLGDVLFGVFEFARSKTGIPRPAFPPRLVKALSALKYVILAGICLACFAGVWASMSSMSPWVAFAGFIGGSVSGISAVSFVLLALIMVGMVVRERFFCQFLCPLGAIFTLLPVLGISAFTREKDRCAKKCGRCQASCPVDIWPDASSARHGECISCGRCADECPLSNVNLAVIEHAEAPETGAVGSASAIAATSARPPASDQSAASKPAAKVTARNAQQGRHLLRGTEVGVVLGKAALLLVLCWVLGATRFLPPASEVMSWLA